MNEPRESSWYLWKLWIGYLWRRMRLRSELGLKIFLSVGGKIVEWDLLREDQLKRTLSGISSSVAFFVPSRRGVLTITISEEEQQTVLPLVTRLLPVEDEESGAGTLSLSIPIHRGPEFTLCLSEDADVWHLQARFRERTAGRALKLAFLRLAPDGTTASRLRKLLASSTSLLRDLLAPARWFRRGRAPHDDVGDDFILGDLAPGGLAKPQNLVTLTMGFVLCPLLAVLVVALVLQGLDASTAAITFAAVATVGVAWTGSAICGGTVSVVAATVGALPLVTALGALDGYLLDKAGGVQELLTLFGQTPLREVALGGLPLLVSAPLGGVGSVAAGIGVLSLAMAAARAPRNSRVPPLGPVGGALVAVLVAGAGPGLVIGSSFLLENHLGDVRSILLSLGAVGGTTLHLCLTHQAVPHRRAALAGVGYVLIVALVFPPLLDETVASLPGLALAATGIHVLFQGTFFAAAYLLGEALGGRWAGSAAGIVEGVGGYVTFLLVSNAVT